ncbi:MAG: response regulator [Oscillochloridaceae bacterium]|nr:response regulator [Chloroflexaceae bacterium]MDW8389372.1 response regulator [Oscillochloridaceae bacterium]
MSYAPSIRPETRTPRRALFQHARFAALPAPAPSRPLARVLVSDDDPDIRQIYARLLTSHDFEYIGAPAGAGPATLDLAVRVRPHLLITDIHKPGFDGYRLRDMVRANPATAHIPVLIVSTMDPMSDPRLAPVGPLDDSFLKPFAFEALLYRVAALLPLGAAAHNQLVMQAQRFSCYEHFHPVTGLPCMHTLARALPALTARPGWAATSVSIGGFAALTRRFGRPAAEGLLARLGSLVRAVAGPEVFAAHPGFDPQVALVGPREAVAAATAALAARFDSIQPWVARCAPQRPQPRLRLFHTDDRTGLEIGLLELRAALRSALRHG